MIIPRTLSNLICEGGFPDEDSLLSLGMAIGVFHDVRGETGVSSEILDIERLSAYELCAIMVNDQSVKEVDIERMKDILFGHLLGGLSMMEEKVGRKRGIDAFIAVATMLPR
jgi:hypothetical protein